MSMKKFINVDLLTLGVGIFGSTFLASQLSDVVDNSPVEIVNDYAREIVGAGMLLVGSVLMRQQKGQVKTLGTALGGTGAATIAAGLARRFGGVGNGLQLAAGNQPAANGNVNGKTLVVNMPTFGGLTPGDTPWRTQTDWASVIADAKRTADLKSGNYYLV